MPSTVRTSADCGYSTQSCSSFAMYAVIVSGATSWTSRQGTGGRDGGVQGAAPVVVVVASAVDIAILGLQHGFRLQHEFRIAECAHFRNVEALEFDLRGDTVAPGRLDDHVD